MWFLPISVTCGNEENPDELVTAGPGSDLLLGSQRDGRKAVPRLRNIAPPAHVLKLRFENAQALRNSRKRYAYHNLTVCSRPSGLERHRFIQTSARELTSTAGVTR